MKQNYPVVACIFSIMLLAICLAGCSSSSSSPPAPPPTPAPTLIDNPGFETEDGWTFVSGAAIVNHDARSGSHCLYIPGSSDTSIAPRASFMISGGFTPGQTLNCSIYAKSNDTAGVKLQLIVWFDFTPSVNQELDIASASYATYPGPAGAYEIPSGTTSITVELRNASLTTGKDLYIDDLTVTI